MYKSDQAGKKNLIYSNEWSPSPSLHEGPMENNGYWERESVLFENVTYGRLPMI